MESQAFNHYSTHSGQNSIFVPYIGVFWLTVETWTNKTEELGFSDKLSLYQGKLFDLSKFVRQAVASSRELVPLEYFYQTRSLLKFIFLIGFLRQPLTILGELVPHEKFSQTSGIYPLMKFLQTYIRLSRWNRMIDSFCSLSFSG